LTVDDLHTPNRFFNRMAQPDNLHD
jgi:hypothetical protein